jgi:RNA polymerase sigma-70 factor (ECF subfamily)
MYESWVREYAADLYRCAFRLIGRVDAAEEVVQESFYEAWRSIDSLRDPARAKPWLLKILRHRYAHWVRDETRRPKTGVAPGFEGNNLSSGAEEPGDMMARREWLQAALDALDDRYKVPFILVFLEGFTCEQVSDFLNLPLGTVLSRIHRGRQFLREYLKRESRTPQPTLRIHRPRREGGEPESHVGGAP